MVMISAIMPTTAKRLRSIPLAIARLAAQLNSEIELVVVSEDSEALAVAGEVAVREHVAVKLIHLESKLPIGHKRNTACWHAKGEWITFWDDDDWSRADRLRQTIHQMSSAVNIVGSPTMLIHEIVDRRRRTFAYNYKPYDDTYPKRFFVGGTLTFRRSLWEQHQFGDDIGEDAWWQIATQAEPACALPADPTLYVAMIHGKNTANTQAPNGDPCWTLWNGDLAALMGADLAAYEEALR